MNFVSVFFLTNVALATSASIDSVTNHAIVSTHPPSGLTSTLSPLVEDEESLVVRYPTSSDDSEGNIRVKGSSSSTEPPNTISSSELPVYSAGEKSDHSQTDIQLRKLAKQAGVMWKRIRDFLSANVSAQRLEEGNIREGDVSVENSVVRGGQGRQFVFHPFLPYGKEVVPDEKISFHDVLPVKMVKFIKGMVEDAPWEQMFMKMVRMVVDQFVDKIIEKMFEHDKEHDDKWRRSFDGGEGVLAPPVGSTTSVVRMKRSSKNRKDGNEVSHAENGLSKGDHNKGEEEEVSWLDSVLEYLFPEDTKTDLREEGTTKTRRKRDDSNDLDDILNVFFVKLYELETGAEASERLKTELKGVVRRQLSVAGRVRSRRSVEDAKRLWQDHHRRPLNHPGECSLRRACNTGRLLARLPSVKDITLQLKSYAKEPHWDALVWGMTKKKCSKIFCKRQRSPKGSKHRWDLEEKPRRGHKNDDYDHPFFVRHE